MLRVSLLGEQAIVDDTAGVVRLRSSRAIELIAYLAVHAGFAQSRQRIAGLFWPDSSDAQALTNLRRELHYVRQVLGPEPSLVVTSTDLSWYDTDSSRVDVRVFDTSYQAATLAWGRDDTDAFLSHAAAAITEYGGDLLPGSYGDWLFDARADLERRCVELCDQVATARARTGDLTGAVVAARRRITLRPLEEVGYRTLMQLQADLGDRAAAVSTYHRCASVLEREMGVTPARATREALQRLMVQAPPAQAPPALPNDVAERSGLARAELIGRSVEFGLLQDLWRAAGASSARLALVRGGAGVGKTRLLTEVEQVAGAQGAVVASSHCFGTSGRLTLAPVAEWLRHPAMRSAAATLEPAWRAEVERLVPSTASVPSTAARATPVARSRAVADAWQRHRFFEGLARALLAVRRPTLLTLDDIQWCDQETLAVLALLLALDPHAPVLVAATLRNDGADEEPELGQWTARMRSTGLLTELTLSPLGSADTARLAQAISGRMLAEQDTELLQAATGGFPLYIVEAARTVVDMGGEAPHPVGDLTAVLRNRLAQASGGAREVAGLAAAVGTNFTLDLLTEASDLGLDAVVEAVDELWRRRIFREFGDDYDFSHDLLRDVAYAQISPPKRWLLHRRIAQGLELLHPDDADAIAARLAEQYARGGRPERAIAYYRRAAELASCVFAHAEAIRLHELALSIIRTLPEGTARDAVELATLETLAAPLNARFGYASRALQDVLERSVELAERLGRRESMVNALAALWSSRFVQGRTSDGYEVGKRALSLVDPESEMSGPAHFAVGGSAVSLGRPAEALHHLPLTARLSSGTFSMTVGTRPDVHSTAWVAHTHWLVGDADLALARCREAIALARAVEHPYSLAVALAYGGITHQMRGDLDDIGDVVQELQGLCERYGFAYYREWAVILGGWRRADESGLALAREGVAALRSIGSLARMPYWLSLVADLAGRCSQPDLARATLDAALATGLAHDDVWWIPEVMRMRAAYDPPDAARSRLGAAAELARSHGSNALVRRCERDLAAVPASVLPVM
jgi:DNA-binding SARP family transcriptional activator/tetratricopeptide (TPR) repeat protein